MQSIECKPRSLIRSHVSARVETEVGSGTVDIKRWFDAHGQFANGTHIQAHGTRPTIGVLVLSPLVESLDVTAVQVNVRLFICFIQRRTFSRYHKSVQTDRTLRSSGVQFINHFFQMLFGRRVDQTFGRPPDQCSPT